jgi:chorismate synthase
MNSLGRVFRVSVAGESHGPAIAVLIDGCPAGLPLGVEDFAADLERRRGGRPGTTTRREDDAPEIVSGVFNGRTSGAPILAVFPNRDARPGAYDELAHTPRPGHADWTGWHKFGGFNDPRGGGHFSGRLTVALVAGGVVAKKLIAPAEVHARIVEIGGSADYEALVERARAQGDSLGGIVECRASGVPPGLGEPFFDSLESLIGHAVFAVPAVKGIEFGAGFGAARMRGSEMNDAIVDVSGRTATNHAGGINGGISNGNDIVFRVAVKPTSSIATPQETVDLRTGESRKISVGGRHDACIALRVPVVLEAVTAIVLADAQRVAGRPRPS